LCHQRREDTHFYFWQANFSLWVIGANDVVAGQRDLKPDAKCRARQYGDDGLATLFGFELHTRQLNFAQDFMNFHNHLETPLRGVFWVHVLCLSDHRQIHASRKI
jgi:hypothetical protein